MLIIRRLFIPWLSNLHPRIGLMTLKKKCRKIHGSIAVALKQGLISWDNERYSKIDSRHLASEP